MSTPEAPIPERISVIRDLFYQAVTQHWAHAEQIRWTLLYNFLMASSILLLGWATVFGSARDSVTKLFVLLVLCLTGAVLSLLWWSIGERASGFVHMYTNVGLETENSISSDLPRPFSSADTYRRSGGGTRIRSRTLARIVPLIFLMTYGLLAVASCIQNFRELKAWFS